MFYDSYVYFTNNLNFALKKKKPQTRFRFTKKLFQIVRIFFRIGCIFNFQIITNNSTITQKDIIITVFFYNKTPFFKSVRLVSTLTRKFFISYRALKILQSSLGISFLILSTSTGLITQKEALQKGVGGIIVYIIS